MNTLQIWVEALILVEYLIEMTASLLNRQTLTPAIPREFVGMFDSEKYEESIRYQREKSLLSFLQKTIMTALLLGFIILGGFGAIDRAARSFGLGTIATGLVFAGIYSGFRMIISLLFSIYDTFSIEQRFGFNKMTAGTFLSDLIKGLLLGSILGALVFAALIWFFEKTGDWAWLFSWAALTSFQIFLLFVAPVVILPLFNQFKPIENGELKTAVEDYALKQNFGLQGIFTMDASKRSTKSNAFFTGFGKFRRLVLFDTLMDQQTTTELLAVVAHEVGHFKRQHIQKSIALSIVSSGVLLYLLSVLMNDRTLFDAFQVTYVSTYASVILLTVLYAPISTFVGIFTNLLSRKFEFEADNFSIETYGKPAELVSALKKLSKESFSHLTPHPLKVLLDYTHPPILQRIKHIEANHATSHQSRKRQS